MAEGTKIGNFKDIMADVELSDDPVNLEEKETDTEPDTEEQTEDVTEDEGEDTKETEEDENEDTEEASEEADGDDSEEAGDDDESTEEDDEPLTFTVKVDGREEEVDEEELVRGYQTAKSSTKRFNEAKKLHDEAKAFFQAFTGDRSFDALVDYKLKDAGGDRVKARTMVRDMALQWLAPDLEESLIEDERERELHRQRREIEEQRKELERQQNESKTALQQQAEEKFISNLQVQISKQIDKLKLPKEGDAADIVWRRAAEILDTAKAAGSSYEEMENLVPVIMRQVKEERQQAVMKWAKTLSPEELEEHFPDQMELLKKKRVERVKKKKQDKAKLKKKDTEEPVIKKKERKKKKYYRSKDAFNIDMSEIGD